MVFQRGKRISLDYQPCTYGHSKLTFRGPKQTLDTPYVACVGGSFTYGRYVAAPFPALLSEEISRPVVNLGVVNAGVDAFVHDASVIEICRGALAVVIELTGAHNLSNRLYSVHPRRNDRFTKASTLLRTIYNDVDFTEFHFTRHMLMTLKTVSPERFRIVEEEVKTAWSARMKILLERIGGAPMLLWVSRTSPERHVSLEDTNHDPVLVDADMVKALAPLAGQVVMHRMRKTGVGLTEGMVFDPLEMAAARQFPAPRDHAAISDRVSAKLCEMLK